MTAVPSCVFDIISSVAKAQPRSLLRPLIVEEARQPAPGLVARGETERKVERYTKRDLKSMLFENAKLKSIQLQAALTGYNAGTTTSDHTIPARADGRFCELELLGPKTRHPRIIV